MRTWGTYAQQRDATKDMVWHIEQAARLEEPSLQSSGTPEVGGCLTSGLG